MRIAAILVGGYRGSVLGDGAEPEQTDVGVVLEVDLDASVHQREDSLLAEVFMNPSVGDIAECIRPRVRSEAFVVVDEAGDEANRSAVDAGNIDDTLLLFDGLKEPLEIVSDDV